MSKLVTWLDRKRKLLCYSKLIKICRQGTSANDQCLGWTVQPELDVPQRKTVSTQTEIQDVAKVEPKEAIVGDEAKAEVTVQDGYDDRQPDPEARGRLRKNRKVLKMDSPTLETIFEESIQND